MKKLITVLVIVFLLISCSEPRLFNNEYKIIDTLYVSKNGYGYIVGYGVIIQFNSDSTYHYGFITDNNKLIDVNIRQIKLK